MYVCVCVRGKEGLIKSQLVCASFTGNYGDLIAIIKFYFIRRWLVVYMGS